MNAYRVALTLNIFHDKSPKLGGLVKKYLKGNKDNASIKRKKYARIFVLGLICSSKLTVFFELRSGKTVCVCRLGTDNVRADKYPSIFSHQIEAIVDINNIFNRFLFYV